MTDLSARFDALVRAPVLLVATDYDGTLAPIVDHPADAKPHRESMVAVRALAALPQTHVAVISGRALRDIVALGGLPDTIHLVGSHGSEFDLDFASQLAREDAELLGTVRRELAKIAATHPKFHCECKPASVAFHYRQVDRAAVDQALQAIAEGPGNLPGVVTRRGKDVVELSVVATNKGAALETIRHRLSASAVLFLGDDVTDEDAFRTLSGPDVGVKVGEGDTVASHRVADTDAVARLLADLAERRAAWLEGESLVPINRLSLLSDQRTIALVAPDARILWYCVPRIDSATLFAELLGGPQAGHFTIRPVRSGNTRSRPVQRYLGNTLVVETAWPTCRVVDFLDAADGRVRQRAGRSDLVRVIHGSGEVEIEFAPRLEFGRVHTCLVARDGGLQVAAARDPVVLRSPGVEWTITAEGPHETARARVCLVPERPLTLELRHGTASLRNDRGGPTILERQGRTEDYWHEWAAELTLPRVAPEAVCRSALTLKALCYGPSGAIAAAGTTSLPEKMGGVRNWDYRYCWLRDAALAGHALALLGCRVEAMSYLDWVLNIVEDLDDAPERLRPLYTMTGVELGTEAEIAELAGYGGSRPVRVGNAASSQIQLDVFGPIVELVKMLSDNHAPLSHDHWTLVERMVRAVSRCWRDPDHGIWEIRKPPRHHVYSKVMCWVTVDRAITVAQNLNDTIPEGWEALRDEIRADILARGWNAEIGAFPGAYDGSDADAASLAVGLSGLLPPDDPRVLGTIAAVERELREGTTVYRYREDDGLPGGEGGFNLCTAWLIESYLLTGRLDDARALFDAYLHLLGPTGLLAEEVEPETGRALGNYPQAYSHIGLIRCAVLLDQVSA